MSKFADRKGNALLVIDVQKGVVADAWHRDEIVSNINSLVEKARTSKTPVIWIQHSSEGMKIGTEEWQIVPELKPLPSEPIIQKKYRSSFEETALEETLAKVGAGRLYICGAQTNNCVRHTSHAALERGYDVMLVKDAHTTSDGPSESGTLLAEKIIDESNRSFRKYELPGRSASTIAAKEVTF